LVRPRVLTPVNAQRAGGLHSDREFDLYGIDALRPRAVEPGRSCTDAAWRHGSVILMLWCALADFFAAQRTGCQCRLCQAHPAPE